MSEGMTFWLARARVTIAATSVMAGCTCGSPDDDAAKPPPSPAALPSASATPAAALDPLVVPSVMRMPSGPLLEILPGQGVGAIRLGATVATIERLMSAPCEMKTEQACRYIARAVEFVLQDGVTVEIRIHRVDRAATPDGRTFGVFNGRMQEGVTLTMLPTGVRGLIGPPLKVEAVKDGGPANTVEIDHYKGMRIEYDQLPTGKVVVGGIIITKA